MDLYASYLQKEYLFYLITFSSKKINLKLGCWLCYWSKMNHIMNQYNLMIYSDLHALHLGIVRLQNASLSISHQLSRCQVVPTKPIFKNFVINWVFSQIEFFFVVTIWVFEFCHNLSWEFCQNLSFWVLWQFKGCVLSQFESLGFFTINFCLFCFNLSFWVL